MISPTEILEVFYGLDRLDQRSLNWLRGKAVPVAAMCEPDPILSARITIAGPFFDIVNPDEDGQGAFVLLARDALGDAADIIAWLPRSERLVSWLGNCAALGEDQINQASLEFDGALPIWRSPLTWLQHGRAGAVLIDPSKASQRLEDRTLVAENAEHGLELRNSLARPLPRVLIPSAARVAA